MPAAELQPFDPNHPVYRPIPADAVVAAESATVTRVQRVFFDTGAQSPNVYKGSAGDPSWTATISDGAVTATFTGIKAPAGIAPSSGEDGALVIFDDVAKVVYRFYKAVVTGSPTFTITCTSGGVGTYAQATGVDGSARIHGRHTGSDQCYTVGLIRPHEIEAGVIPHAIRIASGMIDNRIVEPAKATDQPAGANKVPMGTIGRIRASIDLTSATVQNAINARVSNALNRAAVNTVLKAMQDYGVIFLDGAAGTTGMNIYFEGSQSANWVPIMGPVNGLGTYNDLGLAVEDVFGAIGWDKWDFYTNLGDAVGRARPAPVSSHNGGTTETGAVATISNVAGNADGSPRKYILTIGHRTGDVAVSSVVGGGLTWTQTGNQPSHRTQLYSKQYEAYGVADAATFTITITMASAIQTIAAVVSVFDGVNDDAALAPNSYNVAGLSGGTGGVDTDVAPQVMRSPVPAEGCALVAAAIGRTSYAASDSDYTTPSGGTADFTNTAAGGGSRVFVRHQYRREPGAQTHTDHFQIEWFAATDWIGYMTSMEGIQPSVGGAVDAYYWRRR